MMKVDSKNIAPCRIRLTVKAEADETRADFDEIIGDYMRESRIPGFRIGKAPLAAVEQYYRKEIDADTRSRLIGRFGRLALAQEKLKIVAIVNLSDVIFSPATGISFVLVVDVTPDFKLPKYRKLPLKIEEAVVSENEVENRLTLLRNALAHHIESADRPLAEGDPACGDDTELKAERGLQANAVRPHMLPADEDVCKRLNMESMDALRARIREELLMEARSREQTRQRQEIANLLIHKADFDLPQSQVNAETRLTFRDMVRRMLQNGTQREEIEKNREALFDAAVKSARDRVRARHILMRIAAEEKIEATAADVQAFIAGLAWHHGMPVEKVRAEIEKHHDGSDVMRADIRVEKALDWIIADAHNK